MDVQPFAIISTYRVVDYNFMCVVGNINIMFFATEKVLRLDICFEYLSIMDLSKYIENIIISVSYRQHRASLTIYLSYRF